MTVFLALIAFSVVVSLLTPRHPHVGLGLPVIGWLTIHSGLGYQILDGLPSHPSIALLLGYAIARITVGGVGFRREDGMSITVYMAALVVLVLLFACSTTLAVEGLSGLRLWSEVIFAPWVWLALAIDAHWRNPGVINRILRLFIACVALNAFVVFQQEVTGTVMFFESSYDFYWWWRGELPRPMGLVDSPVQAGMIFSVGTASLLFLKKIRVAIPLAILFAMAVTLTAARVGMVLTGGILFTLIIASRMHWLLKIASFGTLVVGVAVLLQSSLASRALDRFSQEAGSGELRAEALTFFWNELPSLIFLGRGSGAGGYLLGTELNSSLENGWLIWIYEYGLLSTSAALVVMVWLVGSGFRRDHRWAGPTVFVVAALEAASYSSTGASTHASFMLAFAVLLAHSQSSLGRLEGLTLRPSRRSVAVRAVRVPPTAAVS